MTQMMLFDSNSLATPPLAANSLAANSLAAASPSSQTPATVVPRTVANHPTASARSTSPASTEDGVHRMGDLARLVLLRYQLVAKRREAMAARQAKK